MIIIDCCSVFDFTLSKFALEIIKSDDGTCRRYNSPASVGCTGYPGVSVALVTRECRLPWCVTVSVTLVTVRVQVQLIMTDTFPRVPSMYLKSARKKTLQ